MAELKFTPMFGGDMEGGALKGEWETAQRVGAIRIGTSHIFHKSMRRIQWAPFSAIAWAYLRCQDATASVCCGRASFPSYFLMLRGCDGASTKIPLEDERTVQWVLDTLKEKNPAISIGYSREQAEAFEEKVQKTIAFQEGTK